MPSKSISTFVSVTLAVLFAAPAAAQQIEIPWYSIDGGGGVSTGGDYSLRGVIGQHDAGGPIAGGGFELVGGFLAAPLMALCPADFNHDGLLDFFDVQAFLAAFADEDSLADLNNDGLYNLIDVQDFLAAFAAGCP